MIPILTAEQIRSADKYTIAHEPIESIRLMERASESFVDALCQEQPENLPVVVVAGTGNNGGDGLAIARILVLRSYPVEVFVIGDPQKGTADFKTNLNRLPIDHQTIQSEDDFPDIHHQHVVIDGIFGSGLSRPATGLYGKLIEYLNRSSQRIFSIDIASGLFADKLTPGNGSIICPYSTIAFQVPKLCFFQPQLHRYVGNWKVVSIGLDPDYLLGLDTNYYFIEEVDIHAIVPQSSTFDHKGNNGKIQLIAGSKGKIGAAVMSSRAAMRTGTGLLFTQVPGCGLDILQTTVPEAMAIEDQNEDIISIISPQTGINAVGIGPGLGTSEITISALEDLIKIMDPDLPIVLDADALNILATKAEFYKYLGSRAVLTPHPGEFQRLAGSWDDDFEKLELLRTFCVKHSLHVVLKGAYSAICGPQGKIIFNSTGNPGMATGGSGDVLFGMVASFLGQGLSPDTALQIAVYLHGKAGDIAKDRFGERSMLATDIIEAIPESYRYLA